jgi:hypothetical protein
MESKSAANEDHNTPAVPPGVDPDILKRLVTVEAAAVHLDGIQHEATVHSKDRELTFTFRSDEPPELVGKDEHPYPLHYFTAAIGL